jgi:hypothetical protein
VVLAGLAEAARRGEDLDLDGVAGDLARAFESCEDLRGLLVSPPFEEAAGRAKRAFVGMGDRRTTVCAGGARAGMFGERRFPGAGRSARA